MRFLKCKEVTKKIRAKVAIIGAGPAGLTASGLLLCDGIEIDVFDMLPEPGGLMLFGIPDFRIPKSGVREGVSELKEKGVSFYLNKRVEDSENCDVSFEEIVSKYDAVLLATGAWEPRRMNVEGEDLEGIYHAAPYIVSYYLVKLGYRDGNLLPKLGKSVAIIGGGLTAVDSALVALESGAKEVYLVYRRTRKEAPAGEKEINLLENKGVKVIEKKVPIKFVGDDHKLKYMVTIDLTLGTPDATGRPSPIPLPGTEKTFDVDSVIVAVGGRSTPPFRRNKLGIEVSGDGRVLVDQKKRTNKVGIFAAGDVESGPSLIGPAVKSGTDAALSIKEFLISRKWK